MEQYDYPTWAEQWEESAEITHRISCQIQTATKQIVNNNHAKIPFMNIINAICYWTGSTYVGSKKHPELEKAFQSFFVALYDLVLAFKMVDNPVFQKCADMILYRGMVFRYLGHDSCMESKGNVEPNFNDIYVSWSKQPDNPCIESKLYGTMTWMSAEIQEPYYGIDLDGLEKAINCLVGIECRFTRGNEQEVVFPTIEECVTEVKYRWEDIEDDQT